VSERDQRYVEEAVAEAKRRNPRTARAVFNFIRDTLLLRNLADFREEDRPQLIDFVMKAQQVTGPVMAKGAEDTALYRYTPLVSLNEVGGEPDQFGLSVAAFHQQNTEVVLPPELSSPSYHNVLTGEELRGSDAIPVAAALARFPVALSARSGG
jgi:(1->4)-alpha-D-glucan 1-alpha-D-glucosylmutase